MDKIEFLNKYEAEKPVFNAWGNYLVDFIKKRLVQHNINTDTFLKIPVRIRIKENASIIAKAFLRKDKPYINPYEQITDKVGIRFVVLDLSEISVIKDLIESYDEWNISKDVDFEASRNEMPELFVYQSVHYIVRNCNIINHQGTIIPVGTPCEIQIRTLLQHAYAELSHQTVYKSSAQIEPNIKRKLARSMALIETTDELFKEVCQNMTAIDSLYHSFVNSGKKLKDFPYCVEPLNADLFEAYKEIISINNISPELVEDFISHKLFILDKVEKNVYANVLYDQPLIFLLYYLASKHSNATKDLWPFDLSYIEPIYSDLGISLAP